MPSAERKFCKVAPVPKIRLAEDRIVLPFARLARGRVEKANSPSKLASSQTRLRKGCFRRASCEHNCVRMYRRTVSSPPKSVSRRSYGFMEFVSIEKDAIKGSYLTISVSLFVVFRFCFDSLKRAKRQEGISGGLSSPCLILRDQVGSTCSRAR